MFRLDIAKLYRRRATSDLSVLGALAVGALALTTAPASATPLFPLMTTPTAQAAPDDNQGSAAELPARLRRQIVSYPTREAPGTVIIDTPNTYLYYVLGNGQAIRHGIGVGRDGFTC